MESRLLPGGPWVSEQARLEGEHRQRWAIFPSRPLCSPSHTKVSVSLRLPSHLQPHLNTSLTNNTRMNFSLFIYLTLCLLNFASNLALWHFLYCKELSTTVIYILLIYSFGPITFQDGGSGYQTKKRRILSLKAS